jgi:hypothetical protein
MKGQCKFSHWRLLLPPLGSGFDSRCEGEPGFRCIYKLLSSRSVTSELPFHFFYCLPTCTTKIIRHPVKQATLPPAALRSRSIHLRIEPQAPATPVVVQQPRCRHLLSQTDHTARDYDTSPGRVQPLGESNRTLDRVVPRPRVVIKGHQTRRAAAAAGSPKPRGMSRRPFHRGGRTTRGYARVSARVPGQWTVHAACLVLYQMMTTVLPVFSSRRRLEAERWICEVSESVLS